VEIGTVTINYMTKPSWIYRILNYGKLFI